MMFCISVGMQNIILILNKTMKKLFTISALLICIISNAQNFVWAKQIGGVGPDYSTSICTDPSGNVYTAGTFSGTADFDPGAASYPLTATAGGYDMYIVKLNSAGVFQWVIQIGNASTEYLNGIATDPSGNIYATGSFSGTVDFNPSGTITNLTSAGNLDIFVLKLTTNGIYSWAKRMGGTLADEGSAIAVDNSGSAYTTGYYNGTANFNPAGTYTISNFGGKDIFVSCLNSSGTFLWAQAMSGSTDEEGLGLSLSGGYLYVTGYFTGSTDFDRQTSVGYLTSFGGEDIFVSRRSTSTGGGQAIQLGGTNTDRGLAIANDPSGNVLVTGYFRGLADFDPDAGVVNLSSVSSGYDAFTCKLDNTVNMYYIWANKIGSASYDAAVAIKTDALGDVYTTGTFGGGMDFDPGAGTYSLTPGNSDAYVTKLNSAGNFVWAKSWGSATGGDEGKGIALDANGNIYTTGRFTYTCDFDPSAATYSLTTAGSDEVYVHKLSCTLPSTVTTTSNLVPICVGTSATYTIGITSAIENGVSYSWNSVGPAGISFSPSTGTNTSISYTASSGFSVVVTATNACGTTTTMVQAITPYALPTLSISAAPSATICSGTPTQLTASGANTYTWTGPSAITNGIYTPMYTGGIYTVTGTNVNNCVNTNTVNILVNALPNVTAVASSSAICTGNTATLTAGGASTYTWSSGPQTQTYVVAFQGTYNVTGADINGCVNSKTISLIVNPLPNVTASPSNGYICTGQTATFTASGATTYTWTGGPTNAILTTTVAGIRTVSGTDNNGCVNSTTVSLNVTQTPTVTATQSQSVVCHNDLVTFNASGASAYNWSNSITNGVPYMFNNFGSTPSTQTVSVRGWNGGYTCPDSTIILTVTVMPVPVISITGKTLTCSGATNILTGNGGVSYTWTPGSIVSSTYAANATTPTAYSVIAQDGYGCIGKDTLFTYDLVTPQTPEICEVTVDSLSQYNNIIWDKTAYTNVDSFIVYREVSTNIYKRIGAQDKNALSLFVDTARSVGPANGDPNITSYRYKLQIRDTCGNYSAQSPWHNTVYFITNTTGTFFWNTYNIEFQGSTPVSTFELVRDNNATGTWTLVGTSAGTSTSLNDPAYSSYPNAIYRVLANGFNCNPTAKTAQQINKTKSNVKNNFNTGGIPTSIQVNTLNASSINIAPNPATSELTISFNSAITTLTKLTVTDVVGKVVYNSEIQEGNSIVVPVNELSNGIYFVKIEQGKNHTVKKFIKE